MNIVLSEKLLNDRIYWPAMNFNFVYTPVYLVTILYGMLSKHFEFYYSPYNFPHTLAEWLLFVKFQIFYIYNIYV